MMFKVIAISIPKELYHHIDFKRGDVPRSRFIVRLLEKAVQIDEVNKNGRF
jgi:metal-responsive CopG/Arc/MetJ family transcriptional regulator